MASSVPNGNTYQPCNPDVVVIGGGFGGCYCLHQLRQRGFSVHLIEAGSALGGVWHWNSYPGARVDSEMPYYQYSLREVWKGWSWSQRFPGHEELKRYFAHVDNVLDLSCHVSYSTVVTGAEFNTSTGRWEISTSTGRKYTCKFLIPATGSSYKRYEPKFSGLENFRGQIVHSASWPESDIDFAGKKVAIIGAGATGVQLVQEISKVAAQTTVYIRRPNLALPMGQRDISALDQRSQKGIYGGLFRLAKESGSGIAYDTQTLAWQDTSPEEREQLWEELFERGGFNFQANNFGDFLANEEVNRGMYGFWASKVGARIRDPVKRDIVAPLEPPYPFATKRSSLEQDYYECLDRDSVEVVGIKNTPIREFTGPGIVTEDGKERAHDIVVLATGYDNMTGSLTSMGLRGTDGMDMRQRWKDGVRTNLGIMVNGYPNMFMLYGPQAPTAFTNAPMFIELQADLVIDFITKLRDDKVTSIETTNESQEHWADLVQSISDMTLFKNVVDSWYVGGNIPGKKREQLNYLGGMDQYIKTVADALGDHSAFKVVKDKGLTEGIAVHP